MVLEYLKKIDWIMGILLVGVLAALVSCQKQESILMVKESPVKNARFLAGLNGDIPSQISGSTRKHLFFQRKLPN